MQDEDAKGWDSSGLIVSLRKSWIRSFKLLAYFETFFFFLVEGQETVWSLEGLALRPTCCLHSAPMPRPSWGDEGLLRAVTRWSIVLSRLSLWLLGTRVQRRTMSHGGGERTKEGVTNKKLPLSGQMEAVRCMGNTEATSGSGLQFQFPSILSSVCLAYIVLTGDWQYSKCCLCINSFDAHRTLWVGITVVPVLQMGTLRQWKVNEFAHKHLFLELGVKDWKFGLRVQSAIPKSYCQ